MVVFDRDCSRVHDEADCRDLSGDIRSRLAPLARSSHSTVSYLTGVNGVLAFDRYATVWTRFERHQVVWADRVGKTRLAQGGIWSGIAYITCKLVRCNVSLSISDGPT